MFEDYVIPASFSALFVASYFGFYRLTGIKGRAIEFAIGLIGISTVAVLIEAYLFSFFSVFIALVIVAPVAEELLKFSATARKKDISSGVSVGLGFALAENMLYFHTFLGNTDLSSLLTIGFLTSSIFPLILVRGLADPALHSVSSGIASLQWRSRKPWLVAAIGIHVGYNFIAVIGLSNVSLLAPMFAVYLSVIMALLVFLIRRKRRKSESEATQEERAKPEIEPTAAPDREDCPDLSKMPLDEFTDWVRKQSKEGGFSTITNSLELDKGGYERSQWVRRSVLIENGDVRRYTEIGSFGVLLMAGAAGFAFIVLWVVFL